MISLIIKSFIFALIYFAFVVGDKGAQNILVAYSWIVFAMVFIVSFRPAGTYDHSVKSGKITRSINILINWTLSLALIYGGFIFSGVAVLMSMMIAAFLRERHENHIAKLNSSGDEK